MRMSLVVFCLMCLNFWRGSGPTYAIDRETLADTASQLLRFSSERLAEIILSAETFSFSIILFLCFLSGFMVRQGCCWMLITFCSRKTIFFSTSNFPSSTCMNTDSFSMDCGHSQPTLWCTEVFSRKWLLCFKILSESTAWKNLAFNSLTNPWIPHWK